MTRGKMLLLLALAAAVFAIPASALAQDDKADKDATPRIVGEVKKAELNKTAPDFVLPDFKGRATKLSKFKGKIIVLEWFSPTCPFVEKSHKKGGLKKLSRKVCKKKDVIWFSINSEGEGHEGHGVKKTLKVARKYKMKNPILFDETGVVGKAYGAKYAPEIFIIDKNFKLVYRGCEDNHQDVESGLDDDAVNHVEQVVAALKKGEKPEVQQTKPHG